MTSPLANAAGALPLVLVGVGAAWLLLSAAMQWGARHAAALAARDAPAAFRMPVGLSPGSDAVHLAFLGDLQRGVTDVPRPLARILKDEQVDLLVSSGDFASHGEGPYYGVVLAAFARAGLDRPCRVVPGNHDLWPRRSKDDRIGGAAFEMRLGPRHWALRAGPVLVVGLDNGAHWLVDEQLPWLEEHLDAHPGMPWILVCHRPVFLFDQPDCPPDADLEALAALLRRRPPLLAVSGHLHTYRDEIVDGVRHIVNAHGGDVHGLALRRADFELLHVRVGPEGVTVKPRRYARRRDPRASLDQLAVRFWSDRRRPWGAVLAWPFGLLLRAFGLYVPVVRYPVERRVPDRDALLARRQRAVGDA